MAPKRLAPKRLFRLWALLLFFSSAEAKIENGVLQITSENCEHFITKFSFSSETLGMLTATFKGHDRTYLDGQPHDLLLAIYNDGDWLRYQNALKTGSLCRDRVALATSTKKFTLNSGWFKPQEKDEASGKTPFEFSLSEIFHPLTRSQYHYFVLADCSLEFYPSSPPTLDYSIHLRNGSSELPADEDGLLLVHFIATLGLLAALVVCVRGLGSQLQRFGKVHLSTAALAAALVLQTAASAFELAHLARFSRDGKGFRWRHGRLPLDFLSDTAQNLSETVVIVLVVSISCGWTLVDGSAKHLGRVWAAAAAVGGFQLALEVWARQFEDDFASFHDHDHWPGQALMAIRCGVAALLALGTRAALARQGGYAASPAQAAYLVRFAVLGGLWLLAFPFTVLVVAPRMAPYHRHGVVTGAALLLQSAALVAMLSLFLGLGAHGREFFKQSTLSTMGGLDGPAASTGSDHRGNGAVTSTALAEPLSTAIRRKVAVD